MTKKLLILTLILALILSFTACSSKEAGAKELANINGTVIDQKDLDEYATLLYYMQGYDLTQVEDEAQKEAITSTVLTDMVTLEIMREYYKDKKDEVLPETVEADLARFLEEAKSNEEIKTYLTDAGISEETLTRLFYNQYYSQAFFEEVKSGMATLDADIAKYYEDNKEEFKLDQVEASHILVDDEAEAKKIKADLDAGGDFAAIAKEKSTDPGSGANGGELGFFDRGTMVPEFSDVAFSLKVGEISDPVKSQFGWHIIKVTDQKKGYLSLEEASPDISARLISAEVDKKIEALKKEYKVQVEN